MRTTKKVICLLFLSFILLSCMQGGRQDRKSNISLKAEMTKVSKVIDLPDSDTTGGANMMKAFNDRKSVREYAAETLSLEELSDLLWAANGVNRPNGKRTAASALNAKDIDIYVCAEEGAYYYDAELRQLIRVIDKDLRPLVAGKQTFVNEAPVCLVLVSDLSRFPAQEQDRLMLMGAMDAGIVSANISLYCAATGLATVPRASMESDSLKSILQLKDSQVPLMNHPIGFPK